MTKNTLFAALLLIAVASMATTTTTASLSCTNELVAFSPCLPYISSPPNNLSTSPSSQCCHLYSSYFTNGNASCLCYLLGQPSVLGFPLNDTRITSLSSQCDAANGPSHDLELFCRVAPTLPPLPAAALNYSPSPSPTAPLDSAAASPSPTPLVSAPKTSTTGNSINSTTAKPSQTSHSQVFPPHAVYILWPLLAYELL